MYYQICSNWSYATSLPKQTTSKTHSTRSRSILASSQSLCEPFCQRGALGSNVIKSSSQHQNLVCWRSGAQQQSQGANPCVMPGQTHTGNRHKHFLLGSSGSRGKGRSLLPPSCLTWHFLIKALNLEGKGRMSILGETDKLQSSADAFLLLTPVSLLLSLLFLLSQFRC